MNATSSTLRDAMSGIEDARASAEGAGAMNEVLLCGGTGMLGGAIARSLAEHGVPFRALVRPNSDASALRELGADIRTGDFTDRASLDRAVAGATPSSRPSPRSAGSWTGRRT